MNLKVLSMILKTIPKDMFIFLFLEKKKNHTLEKKIKVKDDLSIQYYFCNCFGYSHFLLQKKYTFCKKEYTNG